MTALPPKLGRDPFASIPTDLPYSDGMPMDSPWHRAQMELLIQSLESRWKGRKDFYCGGNMIIYYNAEQARKRDFLGPDFFVVLDVEHDRHRDYWSVWDETRLPDVIVELLSPSTADADRTSKLEIYEQMFGTAEYFLYDPATDVLEGFRRQDRRYQPMQPADGRLWSHELRCWLGTWDGEFDGLADRWLRFYEPDGSLVQHGEEREARRADALQERAATLEQLADAERRRAVDAARLAGTEAVAREAAEAEVARLKAELERLRNSNP